MPMARCSEGTDRIQSSAGPGMSLPDAGIAVLHDHPHHASRADALGIDTAAILPNSNRRASRGDLPDAQRDRT